RALGWLTTADDGLHRRDPRPPVPRDAQVGDAWVRDRAVTDVDHIMRPVSTQPGHAVVADRELHPGAPAEAAAGLVARHRLHDDLAVDAGQPPQVLRDHLGLERALRRQPGVLPVAAAAPAWPCARARRPD